jgi:signal transduction histidine kinase
VDLALTLRRENPILEPFFDGLRDLAEYTEASLYRLEADCYTLVTYRGPVPQAQALSLSFGARSFEDWVRALETGRPVISEDSARAVEESANLRKPFEELLGVSPGTHPRSQLTVPLRRESGLTLLLILGHIERRFYTQAQAERIQRFAQGQMEVIENAVRYAELAHRAVEAEILLSVQRAIASRLEPDAVLRLIADEARRLTFARSAFILTLEEDELVLDAFSGERPTFQIGCERWSVDGAALGKLEGPISSRRGEATAWLDASAAAWLDHHDFVAAPLRQCQGLSGLLIVVDKRLGIYDRRDERRLAMLASVAGVCLENARLYRQARQVAALEERDRLSRELHDELAQTLGYLKIQTSLVEQEVLANDWQPAQAHLAEAMAVLDVAYSSVREAIFGLRHQMGAGRGFFASLDPFLRDYRNHYGLNVTLEMALDPPPELGPEVELQLARIVQESLTNVRRHAAAREVQVRAEREAGTVVVRIVDDGKGFDVDAVLGAEGQHYGLQIMRERAEAFGGRVQLKSTPGCGSEVTIHIPESVE